jgi:glycosyltransferase involved in cell wall biosynthesis
MVSRNKASGSLVAEFGDRRISVLMIAMPNSVHTARWINQFRDTPLDITIIPSAISSVLHPSIRDLLVSDGPLRLKILENFQRFEQVVGMVDHVSFGIVRGMQLNSWLKHRQGDFDVVHALELQHAGYILSRISHDYHFSRVIISNWGSDVFWFQRFRRHRNRLLKLMSLATHYSCECERDIELAKQLGFRGVAFPVHPNAGPIHSGHLFSADTAVAPSDRKIILVKGYTKFVGRADIALRAIEFAAEHCKNFEIVLYSSDRRSRKIARMITKRTGLVIRALKPYEMAHEDMLKLFLSARVYLGVSMSDGISTSLLEAIASGTFPIQTNTSCVSEWVSDGVNGFIVDYKDPRAISHRIVEALSNDELVNSAAAINNQIARERLSEKSMINDHLAFYQLH